MRPLCTIAVGLRSVAFSGQMQIILGRVHRLYSAVKWHRVIMKRVLMLQYKKFMSVSQEPALPMRPTYSLLYI